MTGVRSPCSEPARFESVVCEPLSLVWVNGDLAPAVGKTRVNQDNQTITAWMFTVGILPWRLCTVKLWPLFFKVGKPFWPKILYKPKTKPVWVGPEKLKKGFKCEFTRCAF